jgi:hypothetical protein
LADRLPAEEAAAIAEAYELAYGRPATEAERQLGRRFLQQQGERYESLGADAARRNARRDYCQALLGANEFLYVD